MTGIRVFDGPPFGSPGEVQSAVYRCEPYARVAGEGLGPVDVQVCRWSDSHALVRWQLVTGGEYLQAWVPLSWVTRIPAASSSWRASYSLSV